jgi:LmbE family N-acetylglucosaminyl deacetylase
MDRTVPQNGSRANGTSFFLQGPILILVAHPDDETIGLGGQFPLMDDPFVIHVTDGAVRGAGRELVADTRRKELDAAMAIARVGADRRLSLGIADQAVAFHLAQLTQELAKLIERIRPRAIWTHPYEGGHPDHDSCAFFVQSAVSTLRRDRKAAPARFEFACYHNGSPQSEMPSLRTGEFLSGEGEVIKLSDEARNLKQRMLGCFVSQREMLSNFRTDLEKFRRAPVYDFSLPPHEGKLFYDPQGWGVTAKEWRELASRARRDLGTLPAHQPRRSTA